MLVSGEICVIRFVRVVQWAIGEECFTGAFEDQYFVASEKLIDCFSFLQRDKEKFAFAVTPDV